MTSIKERGGFVATPAPLAEEIVLAHLDFDHIDGPVHVLEPSAGTGRLVDAIVRWHPDARVTAVEPSGHHVQEMTEHDQVTVHLADFEAMWGQWIDDPNARFDGVVMNPPFALPYKPTVWIDHVDAAMDLMRVGGVLVAIVPAGFMFRTDKKHRYIRQRLDGWDVTAYPLESGAFEGTQVRTCVLVAIKPADEQPVEKPWKTLTAEEKQARQRRRRREDQALHQSADLALEDAEFTAELERAVRAAPPEAKLRTYSPHNQALVMVQAANLGIRLTGDLRTLNAWRKAGRRVVKGSTALRIAAPAGDWADKTGGDEGDSSATPQGDETSAVDEQDTEKRRPRFRMQTVFDASQTEEVST